MINYGNATQLILFKIENKQDFLQGSGIENPIEDENTRPQVFGKNRSKKWHVVFRRTCLYFLGLLKQVFLVGRDRIIVLHFYWTRETRRRPIMFVVRGTSNLIGSLREFVNSLFLCYYRRFRDKNTFFI